MEDVTYEEFINNILETRGRHGCDDEYYEKHHIQPRCIGGSDDEENLIDLFAREHFIAHRLLALENPENSELIYAWWMMSNVKGNDKQERYELTPEEYEESKIIFAAMHSKAISGENHPMYGVCKFGEDNPFYGKHHSEETRQRLSETHKNPSEETRKKLSEAMSGENNPWYGKHFSEEHRRKLSEAHKGKHHSEESRKKQSESMKGKMAGENHPMYGKHHSEETKKKISKSHKGKYTGINGPSAKIVICVDTKQIYGAASVASEIININATGITQCCNGVTKTAGGFHWKFIYDTTRRDGTFVPGALTLGIVTEEEVEQFKNNTK